ncbi:MAG: AMP-binding protein [Caldimonas sp.]
MSIGIEPSRLARLNLEQTNAGDYRIVIPVHCNIAADTVGRFARSERRHHPALQFERADHSVQTYSFAEVDELATRLAATLRRLGVQKGSRVAVHTGMRPETGISHMAIYKLGAIAVTLSQLYGPDTLAHILAHSEAEAVITQDKAWAPMRELDFPKLKHRIVVGTAAAGDIGFEDTVAAAAPDFVAVETRSDDPALLMYTSGSTGLPKGILHGHRILRAYIPSLSLVYNLDVDGDDLVFWSPADWAWVGGLLDLLLIGWAFGQTVVTSESRFDAAWAFAFMERRGVTHSFFTPTALKRLAEVERPRQRWPGLRLRVVCTGGEALPGRVLQWCQDDLQIVCNEFYGLTEVNHLVGSCQALYPSLPGSMGKAYPGHATSVVDEQGEPVADGEVGEIVAGSDDATQFLGYWKDEHRTDELRLAGRWLRTHDLAIRDAAGYFWYKGRSDDLIKSAGYRIGPSEIEDCLLRHPAVAEAAVVASPDASRGSIVKAFVRLREGHTPSEGLTREMQEHVKTRLAAYKYPRQVEYVERFELTSSGKINRRILREAEEQREASVRPGADSSA